MDGVWVCKKRIDLNIRKGLLLIQPFFIAEFAIFFLYHSLNYKFNRFISFTA